MRIVDGEVEAEKGAGAVAAYYDVLNVQKLEKCSSDFCMSRLELVNSQLQFPIHSPETQPVLGSPNSRKDFLKTHLDNPPVASQQARRRTSQYPGALHESHGPCAAWPSRPSPH